MVDMIIKELVFDDNGNFVRLRGEFHKSTKVFSPLTHKVMDWALLDLDYMGGGYFNNKKSKRTKFIDG